MQQLQVTILNHHHISIASHRVTLSQSFARIKRNNNQTETELEIENVNSDNSDKRAEQSQTSWIKSKSVFRDYFVFSTQRVCSQSEPREFEAEMHSIIELKIEICCPLLRADYEIFVSFVAA